MVSLPIACSQPVIPFTLSVAHSQSVSVFLSEMLHLVTFDLILVRISHYSIKNSDYHLYYALCVLSKFLEMTRMKEHKRGQQ